MDILNNLSDSYTVISNKKKLCKHDIDMLCLFSTITVPDDYKELMSNSLEIEISTCNNKYVRIWGAQRCIEMNRAYFIQNWIESSLAIADDGNCNMFIYANGNKGAGLYIVGFGDMDRDDMIFISKTLADFLCNDDGLNVFGNIS